MLKQHAHMNAQGSGLNVRKTERAPARLDGIVQRRMSRGGDGDRWLGRELLHFQVLLRQASFYSDNPFFLCMPYLASDRDGRVALRDHRSYH